MAARLDGVAAGFAVPFAAGDVGFDLCGAEAFHFDGSVNKAGAQRAIRANQRNAAINVVAAAGEHCQAFAGVSFVFGFIEQAAAAGYGRIGGENIGAFMVGGDGLGLFDGQPQREVFGVFTF